MASSNEFIRRHPVATKRALRAILKASDICALQPKRVAQLLADKGLTNYDNALQMLGELPYGRWRDYDLEDAVRFLRAAHARCRHCEVSPQKIIAQGTDWRFLNELKRELKA